MPHIANVIRNTSNILRQRLEQRLLLRYIPESHVRKMSKRHYDVEYKQVNWLESRDDYRNYVLERIEENQNRYGNVLDIGCGDGKALASLSFKCRIGLDFSEKLLKKALKRDPNINVVLGDAEHLPFVNRTFDLVILLDVVEHVADSQVVSEEARRVARSEIILTTDYEG
ncbi:MAG: class I SAM-dependent methyltransferase, partial [Candidatus Bathyarchaeota archaeon]|nr:class I SAM-dependent methyltransferase [Candidatus Bathyarchaeota archaeon]